MNLPPLHIRLEQDEEGFFIATVPGLRGCVSDGRTREEALTNVQEAIAGWLEAADARGVSEYPKLHATNWSPSELMGILSNISGREAIKAFTRLGWEFDHQKGSHIVLRKDGEFCHLTVPNEVSSRPELCAHSYETPASP